MSLNQLKLRVFQLSLHHEYYQVKYQLSSIGFENLAYLQSIEKTCRFLMLLGTIDWQIEDFLRRVSMSRIDFMSRDSFSVRTD